MFAYHEEIAPSRDPMRLSLQISLTDHVIVNYLLLRTVTGTLDFSFAFHARICCVSYKFAALADEAVRNG